MNAFIWNSDDFKDPGKHLTIREAVRDFKLDIVVISKTGKDNFSSPFLKYLAADREFAWFCLPPRGRCGGILVGFNQTTLSVSNVISGEYCIKFHFKSKNDGFERAFVAVYGVAQDLNKPDFF
jgi:hypothetical protein